MRTQKYKYPRTPHLPWSPGGSQDDIRQIDISHFVGKEIVVTEKMDGENTTLYRDSMHARSLDSRHHPSRDWVKSLQARIGHLLPEQWRLCGENLYAKHAIYYSSLPSYFLLFSAWNESNQCLGWDETEEWAELLELHTPKVLYRGVWQQEWFDNYHVDETISEGYVVRLADSFEYKNFAFSAAKWVRRQHVQTGQHWMYSTITPNRLKSDTRLAPYEEKGDRHE